MTAVLIVAIVFFFVLAIVKMSQDHEKEKWRMKSGVGGGENSLTTSELQEMIRKAVEQATAPLAARIDELEEQAPSRTSRTEPLLEIPDPEDLPEHEISRARRRTI